MFGFGRSRSYRTVPYGMFDRESYGLAAKNARVLERIYHKGQHKIWDGKAVLSALIEEHGVPQMAEEKKQALGRIFAGITWGELAAWRISADLADELEPLEAKLAATSQAHDEARHFYVMHDYLQALGHMPQRLDRGPEKLLETIMNTDHLAKKLLGMQLMVEPVALTLFQAVRELELEPVLTGLMPYYELDESRHVALGLKYLPAMLDQMSRRERVELWAFQLKLVTYEMWSSIAITRDLKVLGVDPRRLIRVAKGKQMRALEMVLESLNMDAHWPTFLIDRYTHMLSELAIPEDITWDVRLKNVWHAAMHGEEIDDVPLTPDITDEQVPMVQTG